MELFKINLRLFGQVINKTTDDGLSDAQKTYYSMELIDLAEPELVHDQFAQQRDIPAHGGQIIEFRKYDSLPKATTALDEGVTPDGQAMTLSTVSATIHQYGDYIRMTDMLMTAAIDNEMDEAVQLIASQAGRTADTITRDVITAGTNVLYANGKAARNALVADTDKLTVADVRKAVRKLKLYNTPKIDGGYVGIIHPDCTYDLMDDDDWKYPHQYVDTENMYAGELGKVAGVRFAETTEAKIFSKAGASSANVYATMVLGANAYGTTKITGMGLQLITKPLGSGEDPLNQRATTGWKLSKAVCRLVENYMVRIESTSSFADTVIS